MLAEQPLATAAPFWLTLLTGAAVGAVVSALLGTVTTLTAAHLEARREHRRWLREKRLDAYTRAFALTKGFDLVQSKTNKVLSRLIEEGVDAEPHRSETELRDSILENPEYRELDERASAFHASAAAELASAVLLGPDDVSTAILDMQTAYEAEDKAAAGKAEFAFRTAAQRALRVRGRDRRSRKLR